MRHFRLEYILLYLHRISVFTQNLGQTHSESKIALPLRTIQGLLSVLPLIPRFILVLIPILVIFPEVFWIVVVIPDASGIAAA